MNRRHLLQASSAMLTLPSLGWTQDKYPGKPITFVCPYSAGGSADHASGEDVRTWGIRGLLSVGTIDSRRAIRDVQP